MIACTLILTGVLLLVGDRPGAGTHGIRDLTRMMALAIGLAQALLPGMSRSGQAIVAALLPGVRRRWAGEYSLLVAISTILGASALQTVAVWRSPEPLASGLAPLAVGFVMAAVAGFGRLWLAVHMLSRALPGVPVLRVGARAVVMAVWWFAPADVPASLAAASWPGPA